MNSPSVLVLNYDPIVGTKRRQRLHETSGWNDPKALTESYIADLSECSGGYLSYRIVEWQDVDAYPVKADGFQYTEQLYRRCQGGNESWHQPDLVDYHRILRTHQIPHRVELGEVDEVWLWGFPYAGFWESTMAGRGAYFCNSPPIRGIRTSRLFVTMGFNYERGVGEMLENFGHRVESTLNHVFGAQDPKGRHPWSRFSLYDRVAPGESGCGTVHFAPNSERDYDWGNGRPVWSSCDHWLHYPDLTGPPRLVSCDEWGGGDIREHHRWWLRHLPRAHGTTGARLNNWWAYAVDLNRFPGSR